MDRHLTTARLAAQLGLKPATVQMYAREHDIPFDETPGGHRRFNVEEVRTALLMRKGRRRASAAERRAAVALFGRSRRTAGAQVLGAVRTSDADLVLSAATVEVDHDAVVDHGRSAAVSLLAGAVGVHLSVAR